MKIYTDSAVREAPVFRNGWSCFRCGRVTEHSEVKGQQICCECGSRLGKRADVKARQREYEQRPEVKAKRREYQRLRIVVKKAEQ